MPSSHSPRFLRGHAIQLSSTSNKSSRSGQAPCLNPPHRSGPTALCPSRTPQVSTSPAPAYTQGRRQLTFRVTAPPITSQLSCVPNHPCTRTEEFLLLRDTVGMGKKCYMQRSGGSNNFNAVSGSSRHPTCMTRLHEERDTAPAGQYRPPFDPHHDSSPVVHNVPPVRSVRKCPPDFHFLNQKSISPAVRNVRDFSNYRKTLPFKKYCPRNAFPRPHPLPSDLDHEHTYGLKRLSDARFRAVIQNQYGHRKMVQPAEKYESERIRQNENANLKKVRMTKAARGHAKCRRAAEKPTSLAISVAAPAAQSGDDSANAAPYLEQEQAVPLFKIRRFLQVSPRTCSHRGICPLKRPPSPKGATNACEKVPWTQA